MGNNKAEYKRRKREKDELHASVAERAFKSSKVLGKDISKNLKRLASGELNSQAVPSNSFYFEILTNSERAKNIEFIDFALKISKLKGENMLEDPEIFSGLVEVLRRKDLWIRDVSKWKRKSYNVKKQFSSLVRHLFCKYKVPAFMDEAWSYNIRGGRFFNANWGGTIDSPDKQWFLDIGDGKNIRKSKNLPITFTKRMAHEFLQVPSDYTISEGMRWAQIKSVGGDERMIQTINGTKLSEFQGQHESFWTTVIEVLVNNPMLDSEKVSPIIDYIDAQKFEGPYIMVHGINIRREPENPNFSIKGRTIDTLLRQTDEWHDNLNRDSKRRGYAPKTWEGAPISNFKVVRGKKEKEITYEIAQLLSFNELSDEGRKMGHCVASYAASCYAGRCAIFSLRMFDVGDNFTRLVTIEVKRNEIVQIRGKHNRSSTPKENALISSWALKEGISVSRWC